MKTQTECVYFVYKAFLWHLIVNNIFFFYLETETKL